MSAAEKIEHETRMISLALLRPYARNTRTVDKASAKYLELRASLRVDGQLTACIVRPVPGKDSLEEYEMLAGHRRLAAAEDEALTQLECTVREDLADDDAAHRVVVLENLHREDLTPLQLADVYAELLDARRPSIADVASKVGKSESHVREVLVLRGLVDELRELAPKIDNGALYALAASSPLAQGRMVSRVRTIIEHDGRVTRADVERILKTEKTTRSLATVSWNLTDATLVPGVPACNVCPKRTGQGGLLDIAADGDVCGDDACYADKDAAQWDRTAELAREDGTKVLSAKEAERVIEHGRPKPDSAYVSAADKVQIGDKLVRVENLLSAATPVIAQDPETRGRVAMFQRKDLDAAVKAAKAEDAAKKKSKASAPAEPKRVDPKRAEAEQRERDREELEERTQRVALADLRARLVSGDQKPGPALLQVVAAVLGLANAPSSLVSVIDPSAPKNARATDVVMNAARRLAKDGDGGALWRLAVLVVAADAFGGYPDTLKALGIDVEKMRKRAGEQISNEKTVAAAKAKKGGRK